MTPPSGYVMGTRTVPVGGGSPLASLAVPGGLLVPSPYEGWDCFGLVAGGVVAVGGPDLRMWWTDRAWAEMEPVATPERGCLALWAPEKPTGPGDVDHVEVVVRPATASPVVVEPNHRPLPGWRTIGASGGGSKTTTLEIALAQGARVKYREHHLLRARFAGFRRLPL
jgi:hypothetical protein